jgi:hypothetical protein
VLFWLIAPPGGQRFAAGGRDSLGLGVETKARNEKSQGTWQSNRASTRCSDKESVADPDCFQVM